MKHGLFFVIGCSIGASFVYLMMNKDYMLATIPLSVYMIIWLELITQSERQS